MLLTMLGGTASFAIPSYTGSHAIFGDEKQGYIECYSTGNITFPLPGKVDIFILGSGLKGKNGSAVTSGQTQGGKGGKGAVGKTLTAVDVEGQYTITVAAACTSNTTANKSTALGTTANSTTDNGGAGGYVYSATNCGKGSNGSNGTSYPFGATNGTFYKQLGAGGGGGGSVANTNGYTVADGGIGGTLGGGKGQHGSGSPSAVAGTANTGSGGGGGYSILTAASSVTGGSGANGGSGIVIIRWGYAA